MNEWVTKQWTFGKIMEDMSEKKLKERITETYNWGMPDLRPIPYIGKINQEVKYVYPELTALCPVTGIQDLYEIDITFIPNKYVPELKSLKMYYLAYRNLPISHEHLQSKIYNEFKKQIKPKSLTVSLKVTVRGGIYTYITYGD